jgi:iron complex transport system ATP-binding protein
MDSIYNIENLEFSYKQFKLYINKLKILKNDKIAILGENGSGKSTLLNLISGYYNEYNGKIDFFNKNLKKYNEKERSTKLSYLSQFSSISFNYTIFETILFGRFPYLKGEKFSEDDYEKTEELLIKFNLEKYRNNEFFTLSGGEKRKVMVARVLNQETDVVLLDEPTSMVDIKFSLFILDYISKLEATVIASIHDVNLALQFFKRFIFMKNGRILHDLNRSEVSKEVLYETYEVNFNKLDNYFIPDY